MIVDPVTQRYADALWALATEKGALAPVLSDVKRLGGLVGSGAVRDAIENPRRDRRERQRVVTDALGNVHAFTQNLVALLFEKRREAVLLRLAAAFRKLELESSGQVDGVVESARPLDAASLAHLSNSLAVHFGKKLNLENKIVPELVGGARVIAGNRMIDYSVQGRLEALRSKLLNAPLTGPRT